MTFYNYPFATSIQCEEHAQVSPEEYAEVMQLMADDHKSDDASEPQEFAGYDEWLDSLEPEEKEEVKDWLGSYTNDTDGPNYGGMDV